MSDLVAVDGREVTRPLSLVADVIVVGSGPAGATVARAMARAGASVVVLEEGHAWRPQQFEASGLRAMAALYRDMGTSIAFGNNPMPTVQGRAIGGTSVINGAISWRLPASTLHLWHARDPALRDALPLDAIEAAQDEIETRLGVAATEAAIAGPKNLLLARGAERLGVAHRPIRRNVAGCVGAGRCLQGCPHGAKLSMDRTFLPDAQEAGARICGGMRVDRVLHDGRRALGVAGRTASGERFDALGRHAVVLAASAIATPVLLLRSGLSRGPVGQHLSGHPGVSVTARFPFPVRNDRGATQGHEVTGWRDAGLKIEALGFDLSLLASRVPGYGARFAARLAELERYAVWGAAIRASGEGRVSVSGGRTRVSYHLSPGDVRKARLAVVRLCETFFAAGAEEVYPGVAGFDEVVRDPARVAILAQQGPLAPRAYAMSMTHLFGTARMGGDADQSVVGPDFQHRQVARLYVADSSVFPTNLGVNPQIAIMAIASQCARSAEMGATCTSARRSPTRPMGSGVTLPEQRRSSD